MPTAALVTGAAGFIGSHLCEELIRRGVSVVGVDNFFRGTQENIDGLRDEPNFRLVEMDLSQSSSVDKLAEVVTNFRPTEVFHFAAINGTKHFYDKPLQVLRQNIDMTSNLMDALVQSSFGGKTIYASSSEVYGNPSIIPTPETLPATLRPDMDRDGYAASKVVGEMQVRMVAEARGWDWVVLRIFNCYGERMDSSTYGQVVPEFMRKVHSTEEFTIIGDGRQTRSFCHVNDLVWQSIECAGRFEQTTVNVGNDTEVEIRAIAEVIHRLAGRNFEPVALPGRAGDHSRRCPSLVKLRDEVGQLNLTDIEHGLDMSFKYYAKRLDEHADEDT